MPSLVTTAAGLISGILQAPLTGIFLIVEITGGYEVILPLIIVSGISSTVCHYIEPASFYLKELVEKGLNILEEVLRVSKY